MTKKAQTNTDKQVEIRREQMLPELHQSFATHHRRKRTIRRTALGLSCILLLASAGWFAINESHKQNAIAQPDTSRPTDQIISSRSDESDLPANQNPPDSGQRFERIENDEMLEMMKACGLPAILGEVDGKLTVIVLKDHVL